MSEEQKMKLTGNQLMQLAAQERRRLDEISKRAEAFQNFRNELRSAKEALEEVTVAKKGQKILVNLGAGVYLNASINDNVNAVSSISGNIFKNKSNKEIVGILGKKIKNIDKTLSQTVEEQQKALSRVRQLEQIIGAGRAHMQQQQQNQ